MAKYSLGFHIDGESCRGIVVDVRDGRIVGHLNHASQSLRQCGIDPGDVIGAGVAIDDPTKPAQMPSLPEGIPLATSVGARAAVAGAGIASPSTMLLLMDSRPRFLMNSRIEASPPGVAALGKDAILPGYFGYEARGSRIETAKLAREQIEAAAFELRHIVESIRNTGVFVRRFVAAGPLASDAQFMQILADVLGEKITLAASDHPIALGAAVLGALAAGPKATGHAHMSQTIHAMAHQREDVVYRPDLQSKRAYAKRFAERRAKTD